MLLEHYSQKIPKQRLEQDKTQYHWVDFPGYARYFFPAVQDSASEKHINKAPEQQPEVIFPNSSSPVLRSLARAVKPNKNRSNIPESSQVPSPPRSHGNKSWWKKHMKTDIFHFPVAVNFSFPFRRVTSEEEKFNGRTSGNGSGHRDHRTSWARRDGYRQPGVCGRTEQEPASAGSWSAHRRTSGSRRQWTWR